MRPPRRTVQVERTGLASEVSALLTAGHRLALVACHEDADAFRLVYSLVHPGSDVRVDLAVVAARDDAWVPSLAAISYPAGRFEREVLDLFGVRPVGHPMPQRLVRHAHWPEDWHPMLRAASSDPTFAPDAGALSFMAVEGPGVYEIPVGPVHAGLIEPGHFRFSVVGETILRMKARLWFLHRGVEKLFEGRLPGDGIELAERISGDSAVGHTLAYVSAVEEALGVEPAEPDLLVRAMLLELERMHNHIADLGALANDVGFGIANAHAQRLREHLLRLNRATTGHRLLRGAITVGGAGLVSIPSPAEVLGVAAEVEELAAVTLGSSMVLDRFTGTAVLTCRQADEIGALGFVARASGVDVDARRDHPWVDLGASFAVVTGVAGDVLDRYQVRRHEVAVSAALVADLASRLDGRLGASTPTRGAARALAAGGMRDGLALVEAWRGTVATRVELDPDGRLTRVKVVDPSFLNWPALPLSLTDTIVPDFPLANKSFNQSYAGNDL